MIVDIDIKNLESLLTLRKTLDSHIEPLQSEKLKELSRKIFILEVKLFYLENKEYLTKPKITRENNSIFAEFEILNEDLFYKNNPNISNIIINMRALTNNKVIVLSTHSNF